MRKVMYGFAAAVVLITLKAFVLDDYVSGWNREDENVSVESNQSVMIENNTTQTAGDEENSSFEESAMKKHQEIRNKDEKMPLDQLGDAISEKIGDKL